LDVPPLLMAALSCRTRDNSFNCGRTEGAANRGIEELANWHA
jgi:hypothetical protein